MEILLKKNSLIKIPKNKGKWEPKVLDFLLKNIDLSKAKITYETERFDYTVEKVYVPDFIIHRPKKDKIYIEAKGYWDTEDRAKIKRIKETYPDIDLRMFFQANNKIHPKSKTGYSDVCEKLNIPYCIGKIPEDWFK